MRSRRRTAAALACALGFVAVWAALNPVVPPLPTSDLYTHLGVARHLLAGDGFVNDVVVPLSLAFPEAASVPQPLLHRPPGYPLLLTLPVLGAGGDPARAVDLVRLLHLLLLLVLAGTGTAALLRRRAGAAVAPWLAVLALNPLLAMTAVWGEVEVPAALLLLLLWLRLRGPARGLATARAAALTGLLAAATALLRADLFWVPLLWLFAARPWRRPRRLGVCLGSWLALLAPWLIRNAVVAGNPFFTLQAWGEHLKQTPEWPDYSIYRSLSPESLAQTLRERPEIVAAKLRVGLRYFAARSGQWLPWPMWAAGLAALAAPRLRRAVRRLRPRPVALLLLTTGLLVVAYAPLSHTLRYLAVMLPALSWEIWLELAVRLRARRTGGNELGRALILAGAATAALVLAPCRMPGWEAARAEAQALAPTLAPALTRLDAAAPGPIFTDSAALLWHGGRSGVWAPEDPAVLAELRRRLPELASAPIVLQFEEAPGLSR